jgi:hypothetical protein
MTKPQEPQTVDDIPTEYLICRDLGHAWAPHDVKISRKYGEIHRILKCRQCPTTRTQVLSIDGGLKKNRYEYPEHYTLRGVGRLTIDDRATIRVASTQVMKGGAGANGNGNK